MIVRLATVGSEYARCKRAFSIAGLTYEYPTVMALRETSELLGYLTTSTKSGYIVAGPLWIDPKLNRTYRGLVLMRLVEGYEKVLAASGVTRFMFWVPYSEEHYLSIIHRAIGLEPFEVDADGNYWFKRIFGDESGLKETG